MKITQGNILVCDDEAPVRKSISVVLQMAGYQVETAVDGFEGLQKILNKPDPFELVLTDSRMPELDGLGLVKELRARKFSGKIMVLSGCLDNDDITRYTELAVDEIMRKPFDLKEFRKAVGRLIPKQE